MTRRGSEPDSAPGDDEPYEYRGLHPLEDNAWKPQVYYIMLFGLYFYHIRIGILK